MTSWAKGPGGRDIAREQPEKARMWDSSDWAVGSIVVVSLQQAGVGCGPPRPHHRERGLAAAAPRSRGLASSRQRAGGRWRDAGPAVCLMRASGMPALSLSVMHPVDQPGNGRSGVLALFRR